MNVTTAPTSLPSLRRLASRAPLLAWALVISSCAPEPEWTVAYDGAAHLEDEPTGLALDPAGNVIVTGTTRFDYGGDRGVDALVAKYDPDGRLLFQTSYGVGPGTSEYLFAAAVDARGDVYAVGYSDEDALIAKFAGSDGRLLWTASHPGVALDVAVVGEVAYVTGTFSAAYSAAGAVLWTREHDRTRSGHAVAADAAGNAYLAGWADVAGSDDFSNRDLWIAKVGPGGALAWEQISGTPGAEDQVTALVLDGAGNAYLTGYIGSTTTIGDALVAKLDPAGHTVARTTFDIAGSYLDRGEDLTLDRSGNVLVTFMSHTVSSGASRTTVKLTSALREQWRVKDTGLTGINPGLIVHQVRSNAADEVFVTGENFSVKLDARGKRIADIKGPANGNSYIAPNGSAAVYIATPVPSSSNGLFDIQLTKYEP